MILTNAFTHDPRVYNEAKSLIEAGYNVTVLAWDKKGKIIQGKQKMAFMSSDFTIQNSWIYCAMILLGYVSSTRNVYQKEECKNRLFVLGRWKTPLTRQAR